MQKDVQYKIDNAVETVERKHGAIDVKLMIKDREVTIKVKDNGKGMSKEMTGKIMNGIDFTAKETGHGIGTQQIRSVLITMSD